MVYDGSEDIIDSKAAHLHDWLGAHRSFAGRLVGHLTEDPPVESVDKKYVTVWCLAAEEGTDPSVARRQLLIPQDQLNGATLNSGDEIEIIRTDPDVHAEGAFSKVGMVLTITSPGKPPVKIESDYILSAGL